jgi:hypothetical protein
MVSSFIFSLKPKSLTQNSDYAHRKVMAGLGRPLQGRNIDTTDDVEIDTTDQLAPTDDEDIKPVVRAKSRPPMKKQPTDLPEFPEQATRNALITMDEQLELVMNAKATKKEQKYGFYVKAFLCLLICKFSICRFESI